MNATGVGLTITLWGGAAGLGATVQRWPWWTIGVTALFALACAARVAYVRARDLRTERDHAARQERLWAEDDAAAAASNAVWQAAGGGQLVTATRPATRPATRRETPGRFHAWNPWNHPESWN